MSEQKNKNRLPLAMRIRNAASRTVIDGGRKAAAAAAMAGFFVDTLRMPAYAITIDDEETVQSGGSASGYIVSGPYAALNVYGTTEDTILVSGGVETIYEGGLSLRTVISLGGIEEILEGGLARSAAVYSSGVQVVYGAASNTSIYQNAIQAVAYGGISYSASVFNGGIQLAVSEGIISGTALHGGALLEVQPGGSAYGIIADNNAVLYLNDGMTSGTVISSGASMIVNSGTAISTIISSGGQTSIYGSVYVNGIELQEGANFDFSVNSNFNLNGTVGGSNAEIVCGRISGLNIGSGDVLSAFEGGSALGITVNSGGTMEILSGGYAEGININGGTQTVYDGGMASGVNVNAGFQNVNSGGRAVSITINSGGIMNVSSSGYASGTAVTGGMQDVHSGGRVEFASVLSGGTQNVYSGGSASWVYASSAAFMLNSGAFLSNITVGGGATAHLYRNNRVNGLLNVESGASVRFEHQGGYSVLEVEDLAISEGHSGGVFYMKADLGANEGDKINILSSHRGHFSISLSLENLGVPLPAEGLTLVEYSPEALLSGGFELEGGKVNYGMYEYSLVGGENNSDRKNYYLVSSLNSFGEAAYAGPAVAKASIYAALNSLRKRMGDLRNMESPDSRNGIWARSYTRNISIKGTVSSDILAFGMEAGYDRRIGGNDGKYSYPGNGTYIGIMAGAIEIGSIKDENESKIGSGSGMLAGAYATHITDGGAFLDLTARAGYSEMEMTPVLSGNMMEFEVSRDFMAFSAEAGKAFVFRNKGSKIIIEPKAEIQSVSIGSAETNIKNGEGLISFGKSSYSNAIFTIGASYIPEKGKRTIVNPFMEMFYSLGLSGSDKMRYQGNESEISSKDSSYGVSVGIGASLARRLYCHLSLEYETGSEIKTFGADAGLRFMF